MNAVATEKRGVPERRGVRRLFPARGEGYVDYSLLFIVFFLLAFGLIMLYSTSSYKAGLDYGNPMFFLRKQLRAALLGVAVMFVVSVFPPYKWLQSLALPAYFLSAALILLVIPFGRESHGAKRWIYIGSVSIQPAEVTKICMIIFLAGVICSMRGKLSTLKGLGLYIFLPVPICYLIFEVTDNLSSAAIVFLISCFMLFVATREYLRYFLLLALGGGVIYAIVFYITSIADPEKSFRFQRVLAWLHPEDYATDTSYQTMQALYAIGSGGIFGKGLGESLQKTGFIPEPQNDMIFSIICEELGLFGGVAVLLMFVLLLWRMMIIAGNAPDLFGSMLVVGVMGHIAIQVILNIAVVTNSVPNTGVTLPFISYGGSAILMQMAEIGMVMNVARHIGQTSS